MNQHFKDLFDSIDTKSIVGINSKLLIIDGTNSFIRVFANVPSINDNGEHIGAVIGFLQSVGALIRIIRPTRCIVVFDGAGGSVRRRKIYSGYKENRKSKVKLNRYSEFADLVDERESIKVQYIKLLEYLDTLPITVITIDNIEADDTIAYLCELFGNTSKITISSTDKDYIQLVTNNITVWNPIKKKYIRTTDIVPMFGVECSNYLLYRLLTGDTSDHIPGIKGIGLKTIIKNIPEIVNRNFSIDDLLQYCEDKVNSGAASKMYQTIINNRDQIFLNQKLMSLKPVDISANSKIKIQEIVANSNTFINTKQFLKLYTRDFLNSFMKNPIDWLQNTFNSLKYARKTP
jgi:DNA polymerase-1